MKFLIDADCPRSIGVFLKGSGHHVLDIRDIKANTPDGEIYRLIQRESMILITRDVDFGNILRYPVIGQYGIILLRTHFLPTNEIIALIKDFLDVTGEKDITGSLSIIRKGRYRIHRF